MMKKRFVFVPAFFILFAVLVFSACDSKKDDSEIVEGGKCQYDGVTECSEDKKAVLECVNQTWTVKTICRFSFGEYCRIVSGQASCNEDVPENGDTGNSGDTGDSGNTGNSGNTGDSGNTGNSGLESCDDVQEGEKRTVSCGLNGNGEQEQICKSEVWVNLGDCDDPDECKNDDVRENPCGLNDEGTQTQKCVDGQWENEGGCSDPDGCENGKYQTIDGVVSKCESGEWIYYRETRQWGTDKNDRGNGLSVDSSGNIFVTGSTESMLDGEDNAGKWDIFLTKWGKDSSKAWTELRGTADWDYGNSVAVDHEGNIYVAGTTKWDLDGNPRIGGLDAVLLKWGADGEWVWTKLWGTVEDDEGISVAVDSTGNIFVAGKTLDALDGNTHFGSSDIFLVKFNSDGSKLWTKQWGTSGPDQISQITIGNDDNIYMTGYTMGSLNGGTHIGLEDVFVKKINNDGDIIFTELVGTVDKDMGNSIVLDDDGNIFVAGQTYGVFADDSSGGNWDFFVFKMDPSGNTEWVRQKGTVGGDIGRSVAVDGSGNVYATGVSTGSFDDHTGSGYDDIFIIKYDAAGEKKWSKLWGAESDDSVNSIALDSAGNIYVTGLTTGSMDLNEHQGGYDIFLTIWPAQ